MFCKFHLSGPACGVSGFGHGTGATETRVNLGSLEPKCSASIAPGSTPGQSHSHFGVSLQVAGSRGLIVAVIEESGLGFVRIMDVSEAVCVAVIIAISF